MVAIVGSLTKSANAKAAKQRSTTVDLRTRPVGPTARGAMLGLVNVESKAFGETSSTCSSAVDILGVR